MFVKDLYLFKSTDELQGATNLDEKSYRLLGYKKLLESAEKIYALAKLAEMDGDEERAYILYFRACYIYKMSRSSKDYDEKRDRSHWLEMGGKNTKTALLKSEELFCSLKRRYDLRAESDVLAEAAQNNLRVDAKTAARSGTAAVVAGGDTMIDGDSDEIGKNVEPKTMTSQDLYRELQKNPPPVLILDTRDRTEYNLCRIKSSNSINVPLSEFRNCYTASQFENQLPIGDRTRFRQRQIYQHIILVDSQSENVENVSRAHPLAILSAALFEYDQRPTKHPPRLLVGGFESWHLQFPSLTTNPSEYQPPVSDFGLSNLGNSYNQNLFSYPDWESIFARETPSAPQPQQPSMHMPQIPDRSKKPAFNKKPSANGDHGTTDVGDYVQLHIPDPLVNRDHHFDVNIDDAQVILDEATSMHIGLRDHLDSIEARLRSVKIDENGGNETSKQHQQESRRLDDLLTKVEQKEAEIKRMQEIERLRRLKPNVETMQARRDAEEARATISVLENEIESLTHQLQTRDREQKERMDAEERARLVNVERLRQERKLRDAATVDPPKDNGATSGRDHRTYMGVRGGARPDASPPQSDDDIESGKMRRSHSTPFINRVEDEPPIVPIVQPTVANPPTVSSQTPVPDRSTKPPPGAFNSAQAERAELEFYTLAIRRINGAEGRVIPGLTGLKNLGNSCYMNSTIQCLSNIPSFVAYFTQGHYRRSINYTSTFGSRGDVTRNFAVLLGAMWEGRFKYIFPTHFKQCIGKVAPVFAGYDQQDSQEFLAFLLDGLHEDLNQVQERRSIPEQNNEGLSVEAAADRAWKNHKLLHSSFIVDLFQGQYLSVVKCRVCHQESRTFDVFMYLSLPITSDRKCRLEDCLERYLAVEDMTGDCKWHCPHCNRKRDAVKKISIWKLPKVLLIHLNRFSCNGRWREKLQTNVDFPTTRLDMSEYSYAQESTYSLIGVSNHSGTMEGGHYWANCKNAHDNHWYKFDDHDVSPISQGNVKSPNAYILYYISDNFGSIARR